MSKPRLFCPDSCLFLPDCCEIDLKDCYHKDDKAVEPPDRIEIMYRQGGRPVWKQAEIVGTNLNKVYVKEKGVEAISLMLASSPLLRKK